MTLRVPLARAASSGLRRVATSEEFARALEVLGQPPKRSTAMWAKRAVVYEEKIKSGDPHLVAEVVRDLRKNVDSGGQSSSERAVFEAAVERLAAEFAAVERMDRKEAISKVMELTKASRDGAARPERAASSVPAAARNGGPEGVPTHSP
jgi:CarD family transcriptional regulator